VLESFVGEHTARADSSFPARTVVFFSPNGVNPTQWFPTTTGPSYALSPTLQPLATLKHKVNVISGLANYAAYAPKIAGDHAAGTGAFLTCAIPQKNTVQAGISMDQVIAQRIGDQTPLPSMQLGLVKQGACDVAAWPCDYVSTVSWASPIRPLPTVSNPTTAFNQIFDGAEIDASAAEKARRKARRLSVLDYVREEASTLQGRVSASDRLKVDEYLTSVRELEQRINAAPLQCKTVAEPPTMDYDLSDDQDHALFVDVMTDLMVVAMRCDATRVITFMLDSGFKESRTYSFLPLTNGVSSNHHKISHYRQGGPSNQLVQQRVDDLAMIDLWGMERFALLIEKMDAVEEGDGTLLDHSQVMYASEFENGQYHHHVNIPVVMAGGCHGNYATGRHIAYEPGASFNLDYRNDPVANVGLRETQNDALYEACEPIANLYVRMIQAAGLTDVTTFGVDGVEPLSGLDTA